MNSRERMLASLSCEPVYYIPCSFMIFYNLYSRCKTEMQFVEEQLKLGLDALVHVGRLCHDMHQYGTLHPDVKVR